MKFCPLFSSSSGNSVYIGNGNSGILIDVGRNAKQMCNKLSEINVNPEGIKAIFITHEHSDHIAGLKVFSKKYGIPVYASSGTLKCLREKQLIADNVSDITVPEEGVEIADFFVKPFKTSHDCADSRGYTVSYVNGNGKAAVLTDSGYVSSDMLKEITGSNLVYLESNHDIDMLKTGDYHYLLKQRILSDKGHLSNDACADTLRALVNRGTTQFVLAHLSPENNTPELAYDTSVSSLSEIGALIGRDYLLDVASPENNRKPYIVL